MTRKPEGKLDFDGVRYLWSRLMQKLSGYAKKTENCHRGRRRDGNGTTTVTITSADKTRKVQIQNGQKGDTGPQGPKGEKGEPRARQVADRAAGRKGRQGCNGPNRLPQGPKGDKGATGAQPGRRGQRAIRAVNRRRPGPQGPQGDTGPQGPEGTGRGDVYPERNRALHHDDVNPSVTAQPLTPPLKRGGRERKERTLAG